MCIHELSHKLNVSADLQVGLISKYAEVTEASDASVSTMAYHIAHKQYDRDTDLSPRTFNIPTDSFYLNSLAKNCLLHKFLMFLYLLSVTENTCIAVTLCKKSNLIVKLCYTHMY